MEYYFILITCLLIYVLTIIFMKKFTNTKLTNLIFILIIFLCYIAVVIKVGIEAGISDWNFLNTLPTANVSPFMFFSIIFYFVMPKKIKFYYSVLVCLLCFGMFMSPLLAITQRISIHYCFHIQFLLDYISHFTLSLWGIYLVKSKQVELHKNNCIFGGAIIIIVAFIMLIANVLFNTEFFGLALNENFNIYNMQLVSNPYISALIYFCGLILVLVIGFFLQKLLNINRKENNKEI